MSNDLPGQAEQGTGAGGTGNETWAIALVHGIGGSQPLRMMKDVAEAMKAPRPSLELTEKAEIHEAKDGNETRFIHVRHARFDGGSARFGNAHWADVTYYRQGIISLIGILLMAAFGVRFFASVAAQHRPGTPLAVKMVSHPLVWLLHVMVAVLAILVFPITFASLIYSCVGLLAEYSIKFLGKGVTDYWQTIAIAVGGFGICASLAWIGAVRVLPMRRELTYGLWIFGSLFAVSALFSGALLYGLYDKQWPAFVKSHLKDVASFIQHDFLNWRIELADPIGVFFAAMQVAQLLLGALLLLIATSIVILLALYIFVSLLANRRWHTMVFAVVSVVSIWIVLLVALWPENLANYSAVSQFREGTTQTEGAGKDDCIAVKAIKPLHRFSIDDELFEVARIKKEPLARECDGASPWGNRWLGDVYPMVWFESVFLAFISAFAAISILVYMARKVWISMQSEKRLGGFAPAPGRTRPRRSNWPRLIVADSYVLLVIAFILVTAVVFVLRTLEGLDLSRMNVPPEAVIGAEWARIAVVIFLLAFIVFATYLADALKLVLDVVNHFAQPKMGYPVRTRIEQRFYEIVDHLLKPGDHPDLIIVAHSQGTIITIDALMNEQWLAKTLSRVKSLTVITVGSPLTHVYQNYFPRDYPDLKEKLSETAKDPRILWINGYRIDDFVGTYIENSIPGFPVNVPIKAGGHTRYWEGPVMQRLFEEIDKHKRVMKPPA